MDSSITIKYQNENRIIKYQKISDKSNGIRIYNQNGAQIVAAGDVKDFLRTIITDNRLRVDLFHQRTGRLKTTTQLGKDIIDSLL